MGSNFRGAQRSMDGEDSDYEREQRKAIEAWKASSPPLVERALGFVFKPVGWVLQTIVPPAAIEGALRSADWIARQSIFQDWILAKARIDNIDDLKHQRLRQLDALADSFHRWQVGYAVAEGAAAGAVGLPGLAIDIPSLVTLTLRTVRGIGVCYGFNADTEAEREFVLAVVAAAGANSIAEKNAALLLLRQLEVTLLRQTFKAMAAKAAEQTLSKEAAIIALRDLARQLGLNLTKRKMLQALPFLGASIGAAVNWKFMDDVAWAARRSYQERWLQDRDNVDSKTS
jgi:EcsC protein family